MEEEIDRKLSGIIAALEPTLVAILSVIVGMILLSVMLPLMGVIVCNQVTFMNKAFGEKKQTVAPCCQSSDTSCFFYSDCAFVVLGVQNVSASAQSETENDGTGCKACSRTVLRD